MDKTLENIIVQLERDLGEERNSEGFLLIEQMSRKEIGRALEIFKVNGKS